MNNTFWKLHSSALFFLSIHIRNSQMKSLKLMIFFFSIHCSFWSFIPTCSISHKFSFKKNQSDTMLGVTVRLVVVLFLRKHNSRITSIEWYVGANYVSPLLQPLCFNLENLLLLVSSDEKHDWNNKYLDICFTFFYIENIPWLRFISIKLFWFLFKISSTANWS